MPLTMHEHIAKKIYDIEILTPKQASETLDADLEKFAEKYRTVLQAGYMACITDNPMGILSFQAVDILGELGLPTPPDQLMIHLNTFHTKADMDKTLDGAAALGCRNLLVVSGDGSERLARLKPEEIGVTVNTVTSVELLQYIHRTRPGVFETGVGFNPYEPQEPELEKLRHKIAAGATFVVTQPVLGHDLRVDALRAFHLPMIVDAWMSKKLHLLSECVGYTIPENTPYDPMSNLQTLRQHYPDCGLYLAIVGYKTQFPLLKSVWG